MLYLELAIEGIVTIVETKYFPSSSYNPLNILRECKKLIATQHYGF